MADGSMNHESPRAFVLSRRLATPSVVRSSIPSTSSSAYNEFENLFAPPLPARVVIKQSSSSPVLARSESASAFKFPIPPAVIPNGHGVSSLSHRSEQHLPGPSTSESLKRVASLGADLSAYEEPGSSDYPKRFCRNVNVSSNWQSMESLAASTRKSVNEPNLAAVLLRRELPDAFGKHSMVPMRNLDREFYSCITPNMTVLDVQHPPLFIRKFSPDGRHLSAFSNDLRFLILFRYQGAGAVGKFFPNPDALINPEEDQQLMQRELFSTLFREKARIRIIPEANDPAQICRDFSLYTMDSKFLIIVTTGPSVFDEDSGPEIRQTNESLTKHERSPLEDYRFVIVNIQTCAIWDELEFRFDRITVSNSVGVYLCGNILSILSIQHQRISMYTVADGKLTPYRTLGQYCYGENDPGQTLWTTLYPIVAPCEEAFMSTMKQKLFLTFFRMAKKDAKDTKSYGPLMEFHKQYPFYKRLKMWKFQMLDTNNLLIKWAPEDVVLSRTADPSNYPQFLSFFDIEECSFYAVYEHRQESMLNWYEKHRDEFRNAAAQHPDFQVDPLHSRMAYERVKRLTMNSKAGGGMRDTCARLLAQLPIACQNFSPSPYVDMSLFHYDTSLISNVERAKSKSDEPIRFYTRQSGTLKFTLNVSRNSGGRRTKRFVTHIFHPTDPLIITCEKPGIQICDTEVHLHIRRPA
ncbi:DET1 homolog [Paramacrobiotus metropolitanus]|uniref:DET1 homolog n=1 Tax=Paramacrobiotus metropolitanus TaxID=2943436 RepID=UPI0024462540|nr:DET1 homolog [Paramacrobiotus metropolitanus]XP_055346906.1 DET1 homolog [Paramacrobiotus metropolitanus]XP_055346907.1 DET1 homolog [Paramacrobiotus metropolitanus]